MIKFWKSAAKGKTGCPVRPPEPGPSSNTVNNSTFLDTQLEDVDDEVHIFEKKSKLCLSLHDILIEKKCIKYFIQFMESIDKYLLVKCWLEMENFKSQLLNANYTDALDRHIMISRTKSFDFQCKYHNQLANNDISQKILAKDKFINKLRETSEIRNYVSSSSSCVNLSKQDDKLLDSCSDFGDKNKSAITDLAINLFKQYVAQEAPFTVELPDSYRKSVITNICNPEGVIKEDCFKPVQDAVFNQIENNCFKDFINSPFYIKAQLDILTNGSLNLKDILYNDTLLFYFTEYLEQESCRHLLEFLMAVMHFRDNLTNGNPSNPGQAQADAIILYDKYFSLQATSPIGFPQYIRLKIESDICIDGGPHHTCFDLPYRIVFKTLSRYVKTFLESELYYKYLSEMIHSVDQIWSSHNRSQSDCSSELSISTHNTLLAMGDPVFHKKKQNHSVPDMTIDSNQLYNADALWQRKKNDGLTVGRINSLGRFESKFDPDPDKKNESVLKKMVSRFVPTVTSKVEEEMAWQIAHMIVKDVTDLTMAAPENEHDDN